MTTTQKAGFFVFAFGFLLYLNTVPNDYSLDDMFVTAQSDLAKEGLKSVPKILTTPYYQVDRKNSEYRPMAKISFAIESEFFGENPHVSHLIQAFLYAFTCLIVFQFLLFVFPETHILFSLCATLLFCAHPIHTEVVANLKNREELFAFLFSIAFIWSFIKSWQTDKKSGYALSILFGLAALMSKQSSTVIILWTPLFLFIKDRRVSLKALVTISLGIFVSFIVFYVSVSHFVLELPLNDLGRKMDFYENPLEGQANYLLHLGAAFNSLGFYLQKLLLPHPLCWYYGYDMLPLQMPWQFPALIFFIMHVALFLWAVLKIRKRNLFAIAILIYLFAIAPYLNVPFLFPGIVAERTAFFSSLGFCLALALIIMRLSGMNPMNKSAKANPLLWVLLVPVLTAYSIKTYSRNPEWKDYLTLYQSDLPKLSKSFKAHENYAAELLRLYRLPETPEPKSWMLEESLKQFQLAHRIYPSFANTNAKIGEILSVEYKRYNEAMPFLQKAIELQPEEAWHHFDLAFAYTLQKQADSAIPHFKTAMRLDTAFIASWINLSVLYSEIGLQDSAIYYNQVVLERDPYSQIGNINMGFFFKKKGDYSRARQYFNKVQSNREIQTALHEMDSIETILK